MEALMEEAPREDERPRLTIEQKLGQEMLKLGAYSLARIARIRRRLEHELLTRDRNARTETDVCWKDSGDQANFQTLRHYRLTVLRPEARAIHLARTFIKGQDYKEVEQWAYAHPKFDRILTLALEFSGMDARLVNQRFQEWAEKATAHWNVGK